MHMDSMYGRVLTWVCYVYSLFQLEHILFVPYRIRNAKISERSTILTGIIPVGIPW